MENQRESFQGQFDESEAQKHIITKINEDNKELVEILRLKIENMAAKAADLMKNMREKDNRYQHL